MSELTLTSAYCTFGSYFDFCTNGARVGLDELKDSKRTVCYRSVLISENEKKRLLDGVMENPYDLFYYGKYLVKEYPEQVYELCYKEIKIQFSRRRTARYKYYRGN